MALSPLPTNNCSISWGLLFLPPHPIDEFPSPAPPYTHVPHFLIISLVFIAHIHCKLIFEPCVSAFLFLPFSFLILLLFFDQACIQIFVWVFLYLVCLPEFWTCILYLSKDFLTFLLSLESFCWVLLCFMKKKGITQLRYEIWHLGHWAEKNIVWSQNTQVYRITLKRTPLQVSEFWYWACCLTVSHSWILINHNFERSGFCW